MFTSTYTDNVLTLEIDAAKRSGDWAGASAIDALALKEIGSFSGVSMSLSTGAAWSLVPGELDARGCAAEKAKSKAATTDMTRLCYMGAGVMLADNMVFTFRFTGAPVLSAPHLKVHFVDASGNKVGSLLSRDFPWQAASVPVGSETAGPDPAPGLIPAPITLPVQVPPVLNESLPVSATDGAPSEVPEPRTLALLTAGLAALVVARRRRK